MGGLGLETKTFALPFRIKIRAGNSVGMQGGSSLPGDENGWETSQHLRKQVSVLYLHLFLHEGKQVALIS